MWNWLAQMIELIAHMGAGLLSWGLNYEPELPEELRNEK